MEYEDNMTPNFETRMAMVESDEIINSIHKRPECMKKEELLKAYYEMRSFIDSDDWLKFWHRKYKNMAIKCGHQRGEIQNLKNKIKKLEGAK